MIFEKPARVDRHEALRYAGHRGAPDARLLAQLDTAIAKIEQAAQPKWVYKLFSAADLAPVLKGESIKRHMQGCQNIFAMAVTLGSGVDGALREAQQGDLALGHLMDAAATALIESYAECAQETLRGIARQRGLCLSARFSPGYGDMPLSVQGQLLALLNAQRAIGLSLTPHSLMLPQKSITALCGLCQTPAKSGRGCSECSLSGTCTLKED